MVQTKNILMTLLLAALFSCQDDTGEVTNDRGYDFYPFEVGAYRIYEVEEITYSAFEEDSSHYYLKEEIEDSLVSGDGSVKYLLYRYRSEDTINWALDSIWATQRLSDVVLVYESDVPYCKIAFPVEVGQTWDGNAYNSEDEAIYYYENVDTAYVIGDETFETEDVIRVVIEDIEQNLVNQDERSEIYVRGVGLVEKDYITVEFCQSDCDDSEEIEQGRIVRQVIEKYGQD